MEQDYYKLYLLNYLKEHRFDKADLKSDVVSENGYSAYQEYVDMRKSGYNHDGASELAIKILFHNIGASLIETAEGFLEWNFEKRVSYNGFDSFDEWRDKLAAQVSIWQPYLIEGGLGVDEELVETHRFEILYEIDQFLTQNGIQ